MSDWNPRYVAYAATEGLDPEAMLARDRERYPGGCMGGFTIWVQDRWTEWGQLTGHPRGRSSDAFVSKSAHAAFDAWLALRETPRDELSARLRAAKESIDAAYWAFTRQSRAQPPALVCPEAYLERNAIETELKRRKRAA